MSILDMSCIARISASVSPAPVASGPRRTYNRTLGESAPAPKVSRNRWVALIKRRYEFS